MKYLSPILNATLDSAHQNFLFSPIICRQNNHKNDNLFRQICTTKKKCLHNFHSNFGIFANCEILSFPI